MKTKTVTSLTLALLAGSALSTQAATADAQGRTLDHLTPGIFDIFGGGEGGEGGETGTSTTAAQGGEGGEGGAVVPADPAINDVTYLTSLGLVEGHLTVGSQLYLLGTEQSIHAANTHMKHPGDEIYSDLLPAFEARGVEGFEAELAALAEAVESGADTDAVAAAFADLQGGIDRSLGKAADADLYTIMDTVLNLVRVAADEYAIGVVDGQLVNAHEYQDAYGFVTVARAMLNDISEEERAAHADIVAQVDAQFDVMAPAWPSLMPPETLETDAALLYSAAARIEIAILGL